MSTHLLTIEGDADERSYRIECPDGNGCSGWIECQEAHEVNGRSAADGPYDCDEDAPWSDEDAYEFHGLVHEWRGNGHGWVLPYDGCIVQFGDWEPPDDAESRPPGVYEVDDDWDDTEVYLTFVEVTQ